MDLGLTLGSLIAITILAIIAAKLFPVANGLDEGRVKRNLIRYVPDIKVGDVYITSDGKTGLAQITDSSDTIGMTHLLGDRVVCRILGAGDIRHIYHDHAKLTLVLNDFTQPEITMSFPNNIQKDAEKLLNTLSTETETAHAA